MAIGVDCGGRKVAIVDVANSFYFSFEIKKIDYERWFREARDEVESVAFHLEGRGPWYVEAPIMAGARNIQSTIKVAQTVGLVRTLVPNAIEVAVSSWKKATVGNGNASKDMVREWLERVHPEVAHMCLGNQDLYDAACISLYGGDQGS